MAQEIPIEELQRRVEGVTWQRGLVSLGVVLASILVARVTGAFVRWAFSKGARGPAFAFSKLLTYGLMAAGAVSALSLLGLPLTSLVLTSSALLVGIGFSLQHVTRDAVAGIVILVEQKIRQNDFVEFGGTMGIVREIGVRATQLLTREGTVLVVPNHLLVTNEVTNHSHPFPRTRVRVEIPAEAGQSVDAACEAIAAGASGHPDVLVEPPPMVRLSAIEPWGFRLLLIVWVPDALIARRVASDLRFAAAHAFAERGLRFPTQAPALRGAGRPQPDDERCP